jgi:hypothetical protein
LVYESILKLEEAAETMNPNFFSSFEAGKQSMTCDLFEAQLGNLLQPALIVKNLNLDFYFVNAHLNARDHIFNRVILETVFQGKYYIEKKFNKLLSKQYYDAKLSC